MRVFIGAENAITPLGNTAEENFQSLRNGISGIRLFKSIGFNKEDVYLSKTSFADENKFQMLVENCLNEIKTKIDKDVLSSPKTLLILSTTKADIEKHLVDAIEISAKGIKEKFQLINEPMVVCNACTSGVQAINLGADLINAKLYDHAIVAGCDVVSNFVLYGFQSLFAISDEPCRPYNADRKGLTLGEACAGVVLSKDKTVFNDVMTEYISGSSSNDANHISGPSRTGEGLFRSVKKTLASANISADEIDFISAHGTATIYNDEMEAIAFDRLGMNQVPLNSLKGYFGHTLGAAGVLETVVCMQSLKNNLLIKNIGYDKPGTSKDLNVLTVNKEAEVNHIFKTASGFGGANASLILKRI